METYEVGYFVRSLSSTSINRVLSRALIQVAPEDLRLTEIPIENLPLYSPDYDNDERGALRDLEVQPVVPGALKDAIDWASRNVGAELFRPHSGCGDRRLNR